MRQSITVGIGEEEVLEREWGTKIKLYHFVGVTIHANHIQPPIGSGEDRPSQTRTHSKPDRIAYKWHITCTYKTLIEG